MNGISRTGQDPCGPDDGRLDPYLTRLFDEADAPAHADAFVRATLEKLARARRRRLIARCASVATLMLAGALLAPSVAQVTLIVTSWLAEQLPATVLALGSCACAALLAWRIARSQTN
jgi:hypothetical protein